MAAPEDPPRPPAAKPNVISIVDRLEGRRIKEARERASATHLREVEASLEMTDLTASLEGMDLDAALASLEGVSSDEARISRGELRALRALQRCLRGDTEAGLAEWAEILAEEPRIGSAYLIRARWRMPTDPAGALADYDAAAAADPANAVVYARRGDCLVALNDPDRALANYRRALALDPGLFDVHHAIAKVLARRGEHAEARLAFDRAIQLAPRYVDFYMGRAATLEGLGDHAGAVRDFDDVLRLDPTRDDARSRRAYCLGRAGHLERAVDDMAALMDGELAEELGTSELFTLLGGLRLAVGQREQAIEDFSRALSISADDVSAHAQRARAYAALDEHERALADYDRAAELAPEEPEHHLGRANALAPLGRPAEAVVAVTRALALAPDRAAAYMLRAIYRNQAEGEDGIAAVRADLDRALELAPDNTLYRKKRVEYLMELDELEAAITDLDELIAREPDNAKHRYDRGFCWSQLEQSRYERDLDTEDETEEAMQARCAAALVDLEKALELGQKDEDVYYELVRVHEQVGTEDDFMAALDRAIAALPEFGVLIRLRMDRRRRRGDLEGAAADRARLQELGMHQLLDEG